MSERESQEGRIPWGVLDMARFALEVARPDTKEGSVVRLKVDEALHYLEKVGATPGELRVALPDFSQHGHRWDAIRAMPTVHDNVHESIYRCYHILDEIKTMLSRGDSSELIDDFLRWVDRG